jgi:glycosyl hydrolase family 9/cellulase-like Ig domain-containing protein
MERQMPHLAALPTLRKVLPILLNLIIADAAFAQLRHEAGVPPGERSDQVAVSQMGWPPKAPKYAVLSLGQVLSGAPSFRVTQGSREVLSGAATPASSRWGLYFYVADISAVNASGKYEVQIGNAVPVSFEVRHDAYTSVRGLGRNGSGPLYGLRQILGGYFGRQRCSTDRCVPERHGDESALPEYEIRVVDGAAMVAPLGTHRDARGGWHDATSTDKETAHEAKAVMNLSYAMELAQDNDARAALLDEIRWGTKYLLEIQNSDGSFPLSVKDVRWYVPNDLPRHLLVNVDAGVVAHCTLALAAASSATASQDAQLSAQLLVAARKGWTYVAAHPAGFLSPLYEPNASWRGSAGNVLGAAVELARRTGEAHYEEFVDARILEGTFRNGLWVKSDGGWPGQLEWDQDEGSQTVMALLRYYPIASVGIQARIKILFHLWRTHWDIEPAYGVQPVLINNYYGCNGHFLLMARAMLLMGETLSDGTITASGAREYDWLVGSNPFCRSFVEGLGGEMGGVAFNQPPNLMLGAVLPAVLDVDGNLTVESKGHPWAVGEATLDTSSVLPHVLLLLDRAYTR